MIVTFYHVATRLSFYPIFQYVITDLTLVISIYIDN